MYSSNKVKGSGMWSALPLGNKVAEVNLDLKIRKAAESFKQNCRSMILKTSLSFEVILLFHLCISTLRPFPASSPFSTALSFSRFSKLDSQILWLPNNEDRGSWETIQSQESSKTAAIKSFPLYFTGCSSRQEVKTNTYDGILSSLKKEVLTHATARMNLGNSMLSEISQIRKDTYCMTAIIWGP